MPIKMFKKMSKGVKKKEPMAQWIKQRGNQKIP